MTFTGGGLWLQSGLSSPLQKQTQTGKEDMESTVMLLIVLR